MFNFYLLLLAPCLFNGFSDGPKFSIAQRIPLAQDLDDPRGQSYVMPFGDGFLLVSTHQSLLVKLDKTGKEKQRYPGVSDMDLMRVQILENGDLLEIHQSLLSWEMLVRRRNSRFEVISEKFYPANDSWLAHYEIDISSSGKYSISNRAAYFSKDQPERRVQHILMDDNLNLKINWFSHIEGGRLYSTPTDESLEDFLAERVKGFFEQKYLLGFDGSGKLVKIDFAAGKLIRIDPATQKILTSRELVLPGTGRPAQIKPVLAMYAQMALDKIPQTGKFFTEAWLDQCHDYLRELSPALEPIRIWGILPLGKAHFGLVNDYNLETGRQECLIFANDGTPVGKFLSDFPAFVSRNHLPRLFVKGNRAYSLNTSKTGASEIVIFDIAF